MKKNRKGEEQKKSNSIGSTENKENRSEALKMLDVITEKRAKEGFIWVVKGKTSKQIHPDKLERHLADFWEVTHNKNGTRRNKG